MADLIVGISKTAVQLLADKVKSAIKEEAEQWKIVQRDLVFITGEFEMMQAFLDTATEEHVRNKIVRTWVRQVRDLSYDVEDCIDFVLHLDATKRSWWLRLLPSCSGGKTGAELPVDEAVAETTLLRARVVDVSQRNIRYSLIVDSASKPMDPVQKTASAITSSFDTLINAVKKSGLLDLAGLIGRKDKDLHVVSVCGTKGDLVKVAIVKKMYSDSRIHNDFQCRAWVKLIHPFNPQEFIGCVMTQFFTHSCQEQEVTEGIDALERMHQAQATQGDLIKEFAQKVNTHKYLIVLEDLYTIAQWEAIRSYLPDRKNGSRIILLTHQPLIASLCSGEPCRVSELRNFLPDHSVHVYFKEGFQHDRVYSTVKAETNHSLFSFDDLLGRHTEVDELFEMTKKHGLISVWGIPGVGKSVLVRAVCSKLRTSSGNFETQAWVSVSHPFNPMEFSWSLLRVLDGKNSETLRAQDPIQECHKLLGQLNGLVVIDGLQSKQEWDWIKSDLIQYGDSRNCIIIITSDEGVAKHCAVSSNDAVYNIKVLEADQARELFKKVLGENRCCLDNDLHMEEEAHAILHRCGRIPKVVVALATYLASSPRDELKVVMKRLNDNFIHELSTNPEFDSLRGLLAWMHSYLDACPRHLKKCMLYLSIFPHDIIIPRRRLIRRWIAEGYSKGTDRNSMEKSAEQIFDEVAALSIMQPLLEASKVIGYLVNGFFREYIISRPVEETIFFPLEVSALERQRHARLTTQGIGQHLVIGGSTGEWDTDRILFESLDLSRLRSLTVFQSFVSFYVSDRMRVLRVLDLENAFGVDDISKLPSRLKFLSLRGQSHISKLPESVGDLVQLQTLDIRGTKIRTLPPFITRLRKLQYIRAGAAFTWTDDDDDFISMDGGPVVGYRSGGVKVPSGIGRLQALRTLGAVCVNTADGGEPILGEIVSLPQLKKLQVSGISRKTRRRWSLLRLVWINHLESLSLEFEKNNHFVHWEHIGIPKSLRSLKMYGPVEKLPPTIKDCDNLRKLTLEMTTLFTEDVIELLGRLPNLQTLRLRVNKDQDGGLQFPATYTEVNKDQYGELQFLNKNLFSKLDVLEIACKPKLHVTFVEGAMEKLEQLRVHRLTGSEIQVSGLEHPVSLKQVWLLVLAMGPVDDALKEAVQQQLAKHPSKPALMELWPRTLSQRSYL